MANPKVLVLTGYGINCEEETAFAFQQAGAETKIVHINDLIDNKTMLKDYQIFSFPGGFSYGDDTGSGKALANKIKSNLLDEFNLFLERDTLMLGICNGFQVMVNLGLVPALSGKLGKSSVSLEYNNSNRYQCRWVKLKMNQNSPSVFTKGIDHLVVPVAHGEGKFVTTPDVIEQLQSKNLITMQYVKQDGSAAEQEFPFNPNGAMLDIASVCDETGRCMGMMPHPERNILFTQKDNWTKLKEDILRQGGELPTESEGIKIFKNAVNYYK